MKIFISHSQNDENLANQLKEILEKSKKMDVFIFEKKKRYGKPIDKKIIYELDHSDYLVAIITANSKNSFSVNQELGYAQAKSIEKIPMVEIGAPKGFLIHGTENVEFTKENFKSKCIEVKDYMIKQGPRRLFTEEEEILIKKSAFYRYEIQYSIVSFLDALFYRVNMGDITQRYKLFSGMNPNWQKPDGLNHLKKFFEIDKNELILHFSRIEFSMFLKLDNDYNLFVHEFKNAKRFHHDAMPQEETDSLVKLEEFIRNLPSKNFDIREHLENYRNFTPGINNCSELLKSENKFPGLRNRIAYIISDLEELVGILSKLLKIYIDYQNKFGNIAFKH